MRDYSEMIAKLRDLGLHTPALAADAIVELVAENERLLRELKNIAEEPVACSLGEETPTRGDYSAWINRAKKTARAAVNT